MSKVQLRGVCQVCEADVAVKAANKKGHFVTSLHGYSRPGNGWIVGRCWGAQRPSWETDKSIVIEWRDMVIGIIARTERRLAELRAGEVASIGRYEKKRGDAYAKPELVTYTAANPPADRYSHRNRSAAERWAELVAAEIRDGEFQLSQQRAELERVTVRIAGWFFNPTGIRTVDGAAPAPIAAGTLFSLYNGVEFRVVRQCEVRIGFRGRTTTGYLVERLHDGKKWQMSARQVRAGVSK